MTLNPRFHNATTQTVVIRLSVFVLLFNRGWQSRPTVESLARQKVALFPLRCSTVFPAETAASLFGQLSRLLLDGQLGAFNLRFKHGKMLLSLGRRGQKAMLAIVGGHQVRDADD